jgi:hypothetical protein
MVFISTLQYLPAAEKTVTLKKPPHVIVTESIVCFLNRKTHMTEVHWERYPFVAQMPHARLWLQIQGNLGLASNTVEAYGRALNDYLSFCQRREIIAEIATREHLSWYVHDLTARPNPRGAIVRVLDSGFGLSNATLLQRLVAVRLWYDYLMEEGLRETNPVGRGRYTPGKGFGGARDRGLIPRYHDHGPPLWRE